MTEATPAAMAPEAAPVAAAAAEAPAPRPMPWPTPLPVTAAEPAVAPAPAPEVVAAPATPTAAPQPEPAPVAEAATKIEPETPKVEPKVNITANLEQAGLVMIETVAKPAAAPAVEAPAQQLGRKPKPVAVVADEPLQMVETHRQ